MADAVENIKDKTEALAVALRDGLLEQWAKVSKIDIQLPDKKDLEKYRKMAEQFLKEQKVSFSDNAGKVYELTAEQFNQALTGIKESVVKGLKDAAVITSDTYDSVVKAMQSTKGSADKAYTETKKQVTEQVAIALKKGGALKELAAFARVSINLPENDDEYRRIAEELITKRQFTIKNTKGETEVITIAALDERFKALPKQMEELGKSNESVDKVVLAAMQDEYKAVKSALGDAKSFDDFIPSEEKRDKIANAVKKSVDSNTGNWFGTSFINLLMGLLQWVFSGFDGGFDGLKKSIANVTADGIANDSAKALTSLNLGLSSETISQFRDGLKETAMREAGFGSADAPKMPTLADVSTKPEEKPGAGATPGAGAVPAAQGAGTTSGAAAQGARQRPGAAQGAAQGAGQRPGAGGTMQPPPGAGAQGAGTQGAPPAALGKSNVARTIEDLSNTLGNEINNAVNGRELFTPEDKKKMAQIFTAEFDKSTNRDAFKKKDYRTIVKNMVSAIKQDPGLKEKYDAAIRIRAGSKSMTDIQNAEVFVEDKIVKYFEESKNSAKIQAAIDEDAKAPPPKAPAAPTPPPPSAPAAGATPASPAPPAAAPVPPAPPAAPKPRAVTVAEAVAATVNGVMVDKGSGSRQYNVMSRTEAARKNIQVSQESIEAANKIITAELNTAGNKQLLADGNFDKLSENITKKLMQNDGIAVDISNYAKDTGQNRDYMATVLKSRLKASLTENAGQLRTAVAQSAAGVERNALNRAGVGTHDATKLAIYISPTNGASANLG